MPRPKTVHIMCWSAILVLGVGAFMFASQNPLFGAKTPTGLFQPGDQATIQLGSEIYAANCASCHGENLEGQPNWRSPGEDGLLPAPPHDETGHTWHHTDDVLFGITKYGLAEFSGLKGYESAMPIYKDVLSDAEIIAILSFIKSRWPENLQARHDEMNEKAVPNKPRN